MRILKYIYNSILLFTLTVLCFAPSSLSADNLIGDGTQISPYTIKLGIGFGQAEYQYGNSGRSDSYRGSFEYNPKNWGFELGINRANYFVPSDKNTEFFAAYILSAGAGAPEGFGYTLYTAAKVDQITFSKTFLDFGPTFHLKPGAKFDPYIGIGAGIADIGSKQSVIRGYAKLGVRINFQQSFLYLELEGASVNRHYGGNQYVYSEGSGVFGFGYYFGAAGSSPPASIERQKTIEDQSKSQEEQVPSKEDAKSQPTENQTEPTSPAEQKENSNP
ncbi:hypothetical protein EHQ53_14960 [Leptospira langatensis]|uniref:Outer membrane protein beta-barrel domain-containing protein n=1 Tax=Leptospira langatensis TaxID=2484983 RepID=A0A5F1ZQC4_9LEPT|nr:hypothetical protein [Leptospira langatensis]TGK01776.1 hypothetical protein EHO57_08200 [Leptospira langatensis]TGL39382.1 hypothetical protein EHQ53_14960 [Leptospira langatensis]